MTSKKFSNSSGNSSGDGDVSQSRKIIDLLLDMPEEQLRCSYDICFPISHERQPLYARTPKTSFTSSFIASSLTSSPLPSPPPPSNQKDISPLPPPLTMSNEEFNALLPKGCYCSYCRNNMEMPVIYNSHFLRDTSGRLTCPVLRSTVCALCNATGNDAHTQKYCKAKKEQD